METIKTNILQDLCKIKKYNHEDRYNFFAESIRNGFEIGDDELTKHDLEIYKLAQYAVDRGLDGLFLMERVEEIPKSKNRMEYPTENGIAIPPFELGLPKSELDLHNINNYNLHHNSWTKYKFGKAILYNVFRKLENNQYKMPIDIHAKLHRLYNPPEIPSPYQAMQAIDRAASQNIRLQTGSVQRPHYQSIDAKLYAEILDSYEKLIKTA